MRISPLAVAAVLLLSCGKPPEPQDHIVPPPPCGDYDFIVKGWGCTPSTLSQVAKTGVFNMRVTYRGGEPFVDAMVLRPGGESTFGGRVAREAILEDQKLFLSVPISASGNLHYSFVGCKATSPDRIEGRFMGCYNGQRDSEGSFEAIRIGRREGEQEASGFTLQGEAKVGDGGRAVDVAVAGNLAYVSALENLSVFDVTDRGAPVLVSSVDSAGGHWNDVVVKDGIAFVASADHGVVLLDVTTPGAPAPLRSIPSDEPNVHTLVLEGSRLYAVSPAPAGETIVFDVSDAGVPVELGRYRAPNPKPMFGDHPHDAVVFEDRLYVNHWARGVTVASVANAASPVELGKIPGTQNTSHAAAVGRLAGKTVLFEGGEDWGADVRIFDVTNVASPAAIGAIALRPHISPHNLYLSGDRLYVAWYQEGLRLFDVSNPAAPAPLGYFNTWREADPHRGESFYDGALGVVLPGDGYVYVAESSRGLMILKAP